MGGFPDEKAPFDPSMNQAGSSFAPFHSHFASLSFDSNDHIRLLNFPESDVQAFHSVVSQSWPKGVKSIGSYGPSVDLKLHGYPFAQVGSTSEMNSCILVRSILSHLFNSGWILHQSVNVLRSSALTDSLIFRNQTPPPPPASWFTLSFYLSDRLRLSGADQEVIGDFGTLLKSLGMWQNEEWKDEQLGVYEFKLCSIPWSKYVDFQHFKQGFSANLNIVAERIR